AHDASVPVPLAVPNRGDGFVRLGQLRAGNDHGKEGRLHGLRAHGESLQAEGMRYEPPPATAGSSRIVEPAATAVSSPPSRRTSSPSTKALRKLGTLSPSRTRGRSAG